MPGSTHRYAWVTIQEEGNEASMSAPTEVWALHQDRPFHVDALKKAVKQEFSVSLSDVDAADLQVWDSGQLLKPGSLVSNQSRGGDDQHPLRVIYKPPSTSTSPLGGKLEAGSDLPNAPPKSAFVVVSGTENPSYRDLSKSNSTESGDGLRIAELEKTAQLLKEERDRLQGRLEAGERTVKNLTELLDSCGEMGWSQSEPLDPSVPALSLTSCLPKLSGKAHKFPEDLAIIDEVPCHMLLNDFSEDGNPKRLWASESWLGHIGETLEEYLASQGNMAATASDHLKKKCFELGREIQVEKRSQSFEWVVQPNNRKPRRLVHMVHPIEVQAAQAPEQQQQQLEPRTLMMFVFYNADNSSMDPATVGEPLGFHLERNVCQHTHAYPQGLEALNDIPILSVLYDLREAGRPKQLWANTQWLSYASQTMEELRAFDLAATLSAPNKEILRRIGCRVHGERKVVSQSRTIKPGSTGEPVRALAVYRPVLLEGFDCPMALCTYLPPDHGSSEESSAPSVPNKSEQSEQVWNMVELRAVIFDLSKESTRGFALWANYAARLEYAMGFDQLGTHTRLDPHLRTREGGAALEGEGEEGGGGKGEGIMDIRVVLQSLVWDSDAEMEQAHDKLRGLQLTAKPVVITRRKKPVVRQLQEEEVWHQLSFSPCKNIYTGADSLLLQETDVSDLMRAHKQLEKSHQVKDRLLQCVSHELRTPLHGILNLSGALADSTECNPRHRVALATIEHSATRLNHIVNDILETADGMSGTVTVSKSCFSLAQLVQAVVEDRRELLKKGVQLINLVHPECAVNGDAYRVDRILSHLIENAIKFTTKGSITVSSEITDEDFVRVVITDTGCGIPPEHLDLIWEHFHQGDMSIEREHGGTGLGLTLVKCLVTAHGGVVGVQSARNPDGQAETRFSFTLPLWKADETDAHSCSPRSRSRSPLAAARGAAGVKRSSAGARGTGNLNVKTEKGSARIRIAKDK